MSESVNTADTSSSHDTEEHDMVEHQVPQLSEPDIDPILTAARTVFDEKFHQYLDATFPDISQKLLKDTLTKLYSFYEGHAMEPDKIPFINSDADRVDELKVLAYKMDFEAIGDIILEHSQKRVDRYRGEMGDLLTQYSSLVGDESGSGTHGVLLPVSKEGEEDEDGYDEEGEGYQGGGGPHICPTSPSLDSDLGLEPIQEEEEDENEEGPVFL